MFFTLSAVVLTDVDRWESLLGSAVACGTSQDRCSSARRGVGGEV